MTLAGPSVAKALILEINRLTAHGMPYKWKGNRQKLT